MSKYSMEMHVSKAVEVLHKQFLDGLINFDGYIEQLQLISNALNSYTAMNAYFGRMDDEIRRVLTGLDDEYVF